MAEHNYQLYDSWQVIVYPGHDYFEREAARLKEDFPGFDVMSDMVMWLLNNVKDSDWEKNGVTGYSWRFYFKHPEDATMFKLKFGIA